MKHRIRFIFAFFIFLLLNSQCIFAYGETKKNYGNGIVSKIISVYDGDTFWCDIQGFPPIIGQYVRIRIAHIDAPEMTDLKPNIQLKAKAAKKFTDLKLRSAQRVELRNMHRDKYFRIVAEVSMDGQDLGSMLLKAGLAKPYEGGHRANW